MLKSCLLEWGQTCQLPLTKTHTSASIGTRTGASASTLTGPRAPGPELGITARCNPSGPWAASPRFKLGAVISLVAHHGPTLHEFRQETLGAQQAQWPDAAGSDDRSVIRRHLSKFQSKPDEQTSYMGPSVFPRTGHRNETKREGQTRALVRAPVPGLEPKPKRGLPSGFWFLRFTRQCPAPRPWDDERSQAA